MALESCPSPRYRATVGRIMELIECGETGRATSAAGQAETNKHLLALQMAKVRMSLPSL